MSDWKGGRVISALIAMVVVAEPAAAQTRTHLKVLNDIPESQLFMVMNAVAGSLGVRCDYCHVRISSDPTTVVGGWLWDRDDKPAKAKGLEMMRMVREINASRFGGRPTVTCYTCHRGNARVSGLPPVPPLLTTDEPPRDASAATAGPNVTLPTMLDVWRKYLTAVGQPDRFATTLLEGRDERSENRRGEVRIYYKGGDRYRLELRMAGQPSIVQGFRGLAGWVDSGGTPRALSGDDMPRLRRLAARYAPIKIVDLPEQLHIARIDSIGGRDVYAAETVVDSTTTRTYYFDVASGLLVRESTTIATSLVPLQEQVDYEDYRSVDGIMLPFVVRTADDAPYDTSTRTFTTIRHGVALDDLMFTTPDAPRR
jgi:hypothetical protein